MFHNICDYIKDELREVDRKVGSGSTLNSQDLQYIDMLSHIKKSLVTIDAMENPEDYGYGDSDYSRGRYGRGRYGKRDSQGRYMASMSYRDGDSMKEEIYELMDKAPNERVRHKLEEIMSEMDH